MHPTHPCTERELIDMITALKGSALRAPASFSPLQSVLAIAMATEAELVAAFGKKGGERLILARAFAERLVQARLDACKFPVLADAVDVFAWSKGGLAYRHQEELWMLALDTRLRLRSTWMLARGGSFGLNVSLRDVMRPVVASSAAAFLLVHNHPNGNLHPSKEDVLFTRRVIDASDVVGTPLVDHVIVGACGFTSILRAGDLHQSPASPSSSNAPS